MSSLTTHSRYTTLMFTATAPEWTLERVTPPSRLFGANGLRTGPGGLVYIAQVTGSQISTLDVNTGAIETFSPKGSDIVAPDDIAFDGVGRLIATEVMNGRVSLLENGIARVLRAELPSANGITVHDGRLFVNECRQGGRLFELPMNGGEPRIILQNLPSPNAMEFGPDGRLYFPVLDANEIWRIDVDGSGEPERVTGDLGVPGSVKFDAEGYIVSTQAFSGQVLRIDPRTGAQTVLAQMAPGLDNCTFVGAGTEARLLVSNLNGAITEVLSDGTLRNVLPGGLNWPLDLAVDGDGDVYVADGPFLYRLTSGGGMETAATLFDPGYPGFLRGMTTSGPGEFLVTTTNGEVARYRPATGETDVLAGGLEQPYGVTLGPDGTAVVVEQGTGRVLAIDSNRTVVLADRLQTPVGVVIAANGTVLASEAGRVVSLSRGRADTVVDGLSQPQGLLIRDGVLYIVDAGLKEVLAVDLETGARQCIASGIPVGAPPGVTPAPLLGLPPFSGPQGPFAGIAAGADGTIYVSGDAEGSVLALRPKRAGPVSTDADRRGSRPR